MRDEYVATGPFTVTYEWALHFEAWNCTDLDGALRYFWQDNHLSQPERRAISDAYGREILVEVNRLPTVYEFRTTREVWSLMLASARDQQVAAANLQMMEDTRVG